MTIMMRVTRLFKADMHGLLDLLEEPEVVLKQAIRDMEIEIAQGEQVLAERMQRAETLRGTAVHLEREVEALEGQIDIAFETQNEALARTFIRKKLETDHRLRSTMQALAALTVATDAMQHQIRDQNVQLDAIVKRMQDAGEPADSRPPAPSATPSGVAEEDVEAAFLREQRKRAGETGRA